MTPAMAALSWYWHRLGAMTPAEVTLRARAKLRALTDSRRAWSGSGLNLDISGVFPRLPAPAEAPPAFRAALTRDVAAILDGRWRAFGHLELRVDDPPRWQRDYLVGKDVATAQSSFRLNHRALPEGADVKLIWELSRWYQLVRLAMGAHVLGDQTARRKCVEWLEDWVTQNPPYHGWNWTSALEVGMRLVQFTWIDALLSPRGVPEAKAGREAEDREFQRRLVRLRQAVLPPHVWYVWRHKSVGSSANNHLLGELAGCVLATTRWPALARLAAPAVELQRCWEREVLAQFAPDGGNREQALNYHLFSLEFCWQTLMALETAGCRLSPSVSRRLVRAGDFLREVQVPSDRWDYGDSDDAFVTPFFAENPVQEWRDWLEPLAPRGAVGYWLGEPPRSQSPAPDSGEESMVLSGAWRFFPATGIAICNRSPWRLRWDLSPLGHLSTAAHGHLDALHLSVWFQGVAFIVDPGTGAYYADDGLRHWLASRAAHNGPCPPGPETPRRLGPFLWGGQHPVPTVQGVGDAWVARMELPGLRLERRVATESGGSGWQVEDSCLGKEGRGTPFTVRWQFAPGSSVNSLSDRRFTIERNGVAISIDVGAAWTSVEMGMGRVSPAFRQVCQAPFLELTASASADTTVPFRTTFAPKDRP